GYAGTLMGKLTFRGTIARSSASGKLSAGKDEMVGGLVGINDLGKILRSSSSVAVLAARTFNLGGLAGGNFGEIRGSYATGKVAGRFRAGGLVGYNYGQIFHSQASGPVSGSTAGGLVAVHIDTGTIIRSA